MRVKLRKLRREEPNASVQAVSSPPSCLLLLFPCQSRCDNPSTECTRTVHRAPSSSSSSSSLTVDPNHVSLFPRFSLKSPTALSLDPLARSARPVAPRITSKGTCESIAIGLRWLRARQRVARDFDPTCCRSPRSIVSLATPTPRRQSRGTTRKLTVHSSAATAGPIQTQKETKNRLPWLSTQDPPFPARRSASTGPTLPSEAS